MFLDFIRGKQRETKKDYTVYDAFANFDKLAETKRVTLEARIEKLQEEETKMKAKLKEVQQEIADTKTFLKYGGKH